MEDRHSVSKPRPVTGGESDGAKDVPAWEVDIIRDGSVVVDTFVLNNEILPPRKNKKGKVLWCLPKDLNKTVSFSCADIYSLMKILVPSNAFIYHMHMCFFYPAIIWSSRKWPHSRDI